MSCRTKKRNGLRRVLGEHANPKTLKHYLDVYKQAADSRKGDQFQKDEETGRLTEEEYLQYGKARVAIGLAGLLTRDLANHKGMTPSMQAGYAAVYDELAKDGVLPEQQEWDTSELKTVGVVPAGALLQDKCGCLFMKTPHPDPTMGHGLRDQYIMLVRPGKDCEEKNTWRGQVAHELALGQLSWTFDTPFMMVGQIQPPPTPADSPITTPADFTAIIADAEIGNPKRLGKMLEMIGEKKDNWTDGDTQNAKQFFGKYLQGVLTGENWGVAVNKDEDSDGMFGQMRVERDVARELIQAAKKGNSWGVVMDALTDPAINRGTDELAGMMAEVVPYISDPAERAAAIQRATKYMVDNVYGAGHEEIRRLSQELLHAQKYQYSPDVLLALEPTKAHNPHYATDAIDLMILRADNVPADAPPAALVSFVDGIDNTMVPSELRSSMIARWKDMPQREAYIPGIFESMERGAKDDGYFGQRSQYFAMAYGIAQSNTTDANKEKAWAYASKNSDRNTYGIKAMGRMIEWMPESRRVQLAEAAFDQQILPRLEQLAAPLPDKKDYSRRHDVERDNEHVAAGLSALIPYLSGQRREQAIQTIHAQVAQADGPSSAFGYFADGYARWNSEEQAKLRQLLEDRFPGKVEKELENALNRIGLHSPRSMTDLIA